MPITANLNGKNYVLGKGQVFFDQFASGVAVDANTRGSGERYLGNTPEYVVSSSGNKVDHFDSDSAIKVKDSSVQLDSNRNGKMTCDNINAANLGLWFMGSSAILTQAGAVGQVETLTVNKGAFYQIGVSATSPAGVRKISNVVVKSGSPGFLTVVAALNNYEVDLDRGRLYIESNAVAITDGMIIQVTYDLVASTREQILSGSNAIYGALRFVSNNPSGAQRDHYYPYVMLSPNGDHALKGDTWQQIQFNFEILQKASNIPHAIIDGFPV